MKFVTSDEVEIGDFVLPVGRSSKFDPSSFIVSAYHTECAYMVVMKLESDGVTTVVAADFHHARLYNIPGALRFAKFEDEDLLGLFFLDTP